MIIILSWNSRKRNKDYALSPRFFRQKKNASQRSFFAGIFARFRFSVLPGALRPLDQDRQGVVLNAGHALCDR